MTLNLYITALIGGLLTNARVSNVHFTQRVEIQKISRENSSRFWKEIHDAQSAFASKKWTFLNPVYEMLCFNLALKHAHLDSRWDVPTR